MYKNEVLLHEGGHGHEHAHGEHKHLTVEQTDALLAYMLQHNESHADELHEAAHALSDQGRGEAAALVHEAVHLFEDSNKKLAEAVKLIKGE